MARAWHLGAPAHAWVALLIGLLGVSSAGALFSLFREVPPFLRASWRLWATGILQLPPAVFQARRSGRSLRSLYVAPNTGLLVAVSGSFLAIHFGAWVWSIDHTSLTHSLLWVTSHPIILAAGAWAVWLTWRAGGASRCLPQPPHRPSGLETAGAVVGFAGGAVMMLGASSEGGVTLAGDAAAFLGALGMVVYLLIGRHLRATTPVFLYACPVTLLGGLLLSLAAAAAEGGSFAPSAGARRSFVGWLQDPTYFLYVFLLATVSGLGGHTVLNYVLKHIAPLVVSVTLLLEPLVGSLIGAAFGLQGLPGPFTWVGGTVLLVGAAMVTAAQSSSEEEEGAEGGPPVRGAAKAHVVPRSGASETPAESRGATPHTDGSVPVP